MSASAAAVSKFARAEGVVVGDDRGRPGRRPSRSVSPLFSRPLGEHARSARSRRPSTGRCRRPPAARPAPPAAPGSGRCPSRSSWRTRRSGPESTVCDLAVEAEVLAVGVADDVRVQQRVVERGVEDGLLVGGAAGDLRSCRAACSRRCARRCGWRRSPSRVLRGAVGDGVGDRDVGDADLGLHRPGCAVVSKVT